MLEPPTRRQIRVRFAALARQLGVMQPLDWLRYAYNRAANHSKNRAFAASHPDFPTPPPVLAYDAYSSVDWLHYYATGKQIAEKIGRMITDHLPSGQVRFLEWGCGPACVIRNIPSTLTAGSKIYGCDYNKKTIAWCRATFRDIQFEQNELEPPLVFRDDQFDCTCGMSVLTHLSEARCKAWLEELTRVTCRGGIIILTTKGDSHAYRLLPEEQKRLKSGCAVVRDRIEEGKRMYDTILPESYMRAILPTSLRILQHVPDGMPEYQQDLWILRKQ